MNHSVTPYSYSASLSWAPVAGPGQGYRVRVFDPAGRAVYDVNLPGTITHASAGGLTPDTQYTWSVDVVGARWSFRTRAAPVPLPPPSGTFLFSDEFAGAAGAPPDPAKWAFDLGKGLWGNNELESYTNEVANAFQDGNGNLVIRALRLAGGGYTSARLTTRGKFSYYGGTWEARIRLPLTAGTWPAWWCMGVSYDWPSCGEVDIVEAYGSNAYTESTVHLPDGRGGVQGMDGMQGIRYQDVPVDTGWHVYRMTWDTQAAAGAGTFQFAKDGITYLTVSGTGKTNWPYSAGNQFYTILNLAVGGDGGGDPSRTTFPVDMLVDYVRVW